MKKLSLLVALIGIFLITIIFVFYPAREIYSQEELNNIQLNTKVLVSGHIVKERDAGNSKIITLDNKIELVCDCEKSLLNKEIRAEGKVSEYNNKKQVKITSFTELD